jgi:hypothetical protein
MLGYNGTIAWKTISNSIGITIDVSQFGADSLPTHSGHGLLSLPIWIFKFFVVFFFEE